MRVRAIKDLSQLSRPDFFRTVGLGLDKIIQNASRLFNSARGLGNRGEYQAFTVIRNLAEEEASKFLILLDAVRCPRNPPERFCNQLGRFNDHLSKGLYSCAYKARPPTPAKLQEYLDNFREQYYLDGPNEVEWIFRNEILQEREQALYVDYISTDDGHAWLDPADDFRVEPVEILFQIEPPCLKIARALFDVGISETDALTAVAEIWSSVSLRPDMPWLELRSMNHQTLEKLKTKRLLRGQSE